MRLMNLMLGSACVVVALTSGAQAQYQPSPYQPPQYPYAQTPYQPPQHPASWSYDPYTSGLGPCPQKDHRDLTSCSQIMPPTYGQPSYWPR